MDEMHAYGYDKVQSEQWALGHMVRELLAERGFASVAAAGYEAPGVVVCHTTDPDLHNGKKFMQAGLQTAAGVPLQCQEPASFRTFRIGLFGLDKLHQPQRAVAQLAAALDTIGYPAARATTV
jgi:aspartate aminotransferase-like enzyme